MPIIFPWNKKECIVNTIEDRKQYTLFTLSDKSSFKIGIPLQQLNKLIRQDLCANVECINLKIFLPRFEMTSDQWLEISQILARNSEIQDAFSKSSKFQELIKLDYNSLRQLPILLYSGGYKVGFLYLSYPVNFHKKRNLAKNCYMNFFWHKGHCIRVVVDLQNNIITKLQSAFDVNHYIGEY
ncbi:hypothetical protein [Candidatus Uabimicrobium sp. HlEnr_7]|uniref:hypothetical protein n=1 Tax=Candidatus Uabimicrobium helgolandensis TaxID=3095367 RepID=UPI0035573D65